MSIFGAEIHVAAASDLFPAKPELVAAYQRFGNDKVNWINGSSGQLARQTRHGAPFDVLLSASADYIRELERDGWALASDSRPYALGRLAVWSRRLPGIRLADLAGSQVRYVAIANPAHAPYGRAAKEALTRAGLLWALEPRLVLAENVQQAFQMAVTGNADACVVAYSLVIGQGGRGGTLVDAALHAPIRQEGTVLRQARDPEAARRFLEFLTGAEGRRILAKYGFQPPD